MKETEVTRCEELSALCQSVREMVAGGKYEGCRDILSHAMAQFPDAPQPHNLLGLVLEKEGDHSLAMKHFRAAWALDPTYAPAGQNLTTYGTFYCHGKPAFDEDDCRCDTPDGSIEYDSRGVGHYVRRKRS